MTDNVEPLKSNFHVKINNWFSPCSVEHNSCACIWVQDALPYINWNQ